MSADRWSDCPKCKEIQEKKISESEKLLRESYGKIPAEEYRSLQDKHRSLVKQDIEGTLREDFWIGISKGKFTASYLGKCEACGFSHKYEHEEDVKT